MVLRMAEDYAEYRFYPIVNCFVEFFGMLNACRVPYVSLFPTMILHFLLWPERAPEGFGSPILIFNLYPLSKHVGLFTL